MGRLLDRPSPVDATEAAHIAAAQRYAATAGDAQLWLQPACNATLSRSGSGPASRSACTSDVAVLVVGEFRDFLPPWKSRDNQWRALTAEWVFKRLVEAIVKPNGPADVFVHCWDQPLARSLVERLPTPPCASVCEPYGTAYAERVLGQYRGLRFINGFLRLNHSKETPHIVDFFYKRYAALRLMEHFEATRQRAYRAIVLTRPDVVVRSHAVPLRHPLAPRTIYLHDSDHHHDSTDADTNADPMSQGLCGQMPNDWFAYGDRGSMATSLAAFPLLPSLHGAMRAVPGSCDWWRCHNYRYNHTFLNNGEAYLGLHLRRSGLRCHDLRPKIQLQLPNTRNRDWGPHTLGMG